MFVSCARAETKRVRSINEALRSFGQTTFFDIEGRDDSDVFPDEIDQKLRSAGCVIGVWSPQALSRNWVKKEARIGVHLGRLITACIAPLELEDHSTDFIGWHLCDLESLSGDVAHSGFLEMMRAIAEKPDRPGLSNWCEWRSAG